jgi:hypothetical protein
LSGEAAEDFDEELLLQRNLLLLHSHLIAVHSVSGFKQSEP